MSVQAQGEPSKWGNDTEMNSPAKLTEQDIEFLFLRAIMLSCIVACVVGLGVAAWIIWSMLTPFLA